jgi:hypothetical protein
MSRKGSGSSLMRRDHKMRVVILILSFLSIAAVLSATPASAQGGCQPGYRPCGDFCCGG